MSAPSRCVESLPPGRFPGVSVNAAGMEGRPRADDVEPVANETRDRIITGIVTAAPVLALGLVVWQVWGDFLRWSDAIVFAVMYLVTGLGVTVGFHRYFTHRSFKAGKRLRAVLAVMGSMAIEGPV